MRVLQKVRKWHIFVAFLLLIVVAVLINQTQTSDEDGRITTTVDRGTVTESVSVSGFIEAENTAELSFPTIGIVTDVLAVKGSTVLKGDLLATLGSRVLIAQRAEAVANLQKARAAYDEVLQGARMEARAVSNSARTSAEENLNNTITIENEKVRNAQTILLSSNLAAVAEDPLTAAAAPTVTGTYTCEDGGVYTINTYNSNAYSGYSYEYEGLEDGLDSAYTRQPAPLGDCGLYLQFSEDAVYSNKVWAIEIPNTRAAAYSANLNAYELAIESQELAVSVATNALGLAQTESNLTNADATTQAQQQARAGIDQAQAAIAAIDAQIEDKSIIAPFDGVIIDVDILPGETAGNTPIITLLANDAFTLTARIPEIDINKLSLGQSTNVVFDAQSDTELTGIITYLSPLATEIDGVAYFETTIKLDSQPEWIRSGLNADIDVIVEQAQDTLRVPQRFLTKNTDGSYTLLTKNSDGTASTTVEVSFIGNDGYVSIIGLAVGTEVVAP